MINSSYFFSPFDYKRLTNEIEDLYQYKEYIKIFSIGQSYAGRELFTVRLGKGEKISLYIGTHHALEWGTAQMLTAFIHTYADGLNNIDIDIEKLYNETTIYIIPMLNPDGTELVINGIDVNNPFYKSVIEMNGGNNFNTWQANIRGVDLNHNYDALWSKGKLKEHQLGIYDGGPTRYSGEYPESEKECASLCNFVRDLNPDLCLALHSQGKEIYYDFNNILPKNSEYIANIIAKHTGYTILKPEGFAGYGGFKDWFLTEFNKPGFTLEVGEGTNPLTLGQIEDGYNDIIKTLFELPLLI